MSRRLLFRLLALAPPATDHVTDAELLRRFAATNDSAALELVVRRHADAVWGAALRILRNEADAEDAFQAAFLALIRKAKSIRAACAGAWLHRVAVNAALKLRERRLPLAEPKQLDALPNPSTEPPDVEVAAAVHEELAKLPERERLPVVLCELEGLSHADAAKALGWPVGTVSGRLSRARAKLRERLARRGLTPSGALVPLLAPPHLIPGALSLTAGAPPAVVSLAEGVLAMNATATWKWVAVAAVCAGALGAGGVLAVGLGSGAAGPPAVGTAPAPRRPGDPVPPPEKAAPKEEGKTAGDDWLGKPGSDRRFPKGAKPPPSAFPELALPEPDPNAKREDAQKQFEAQFAKMCPRLAGKSEITIAPTDDTLRKLLKARLHRGVIEMIHFREVIRIGSWNQALLDRVIECLTDMQSVIIELWGGQPKELVPWLEELVVMAKEFERFMKLRVEVGAAPPQDLDAAIRHRLAAEAALWKAKEPMRWNAK